MIILVSTVISPLGIGVDLHIVLAEEMQYRMFSIIRQCTSTYYNKYHVVPYFIVDVHCSAWQVVFSDVTADQGV